MNDKESVDVMKVEIDKSQDIIMSEDMFNEASNNILVEEKDPQPSPKNNRKKRSGVRRCLRFKTLIE